MYIVKHRVNNPSEAAKLSVNYGVEVDVRYHNDSLVLHHDPFNHHIDKPATLEELLRMWRGEGPLILNVKTEGVEQQCLELIQKYKIRNWFFLDLSMPYFVKYALSVSNNLYPGLDKSNLAVRFSEHEPIEYAKSFKGRAGWVWVDFFTKNPLTKEAYTELKECGYKICLVSPELQGHEKEKVIQLKKDCEDFQIEGVCTKHPELWV